MDLGGDLMLFQNYRDIFYINETLPLNSEEFCQIKKDVLPLISKFNCEIVNYAIKNEQITLVISKASLLSKNSGRVNLVIKMNNERDKLIIEAQIKQNIVAVIFLFIITSFNLFCFSMLLIAFLELKLLSYIVILFTAFTIYIFYRIVSIKDDNVIILEKVYLEICEKYKNR